MFLQHRSLQQGSWIQRDRLDFYSSPHHILSDQMNPAVEFNLNKSILQLCLEFLRPSLSLIR